MFRIQGEYTTAKIFTDNIEEGALSQVYDICNHIAFKNSKIRIMPDVHKGAGICIGFTAELKDKVIPNVVGVDIGCGVLAVNLGNIDINLEKLDKFIRKNIPSGFDGYGNPEFKLNGYEKDICNTIGLNKDKQASKLGTLGGGNHFIEVDLDKNDNKYLLIHTGSRNFGYKIAKYWQDKAIKVFENKRNKKRQNLIESLKDQNRHQEIEEKLKEFKNRNKLSKQLRYLEGDNKSNYLLNMEVAQSYAKANRKFISEKILNYLGLSIGEVSYIDTVHNYIGGDDIIRKGAVSAKKGEKLVIPLNMKDGAIIADGRGNPDWNYSAPHGAGRVMSRTEAKKKLNIDKFKNDMKDIYSKSISSNTLDESPRAYKNKNLILDNTNETIEVIKRLKPIYNFKDGGEQ